MSKKKADRKPELIRKTSIGGQALLEGIMMRGPQKTSIAVRNPKGEIVLEEIKTNTKKRPAICRWPLIRGVFGFIDSLTLGYKSLMRSAEIYMPEEEETKPLEESSPEDGPAAEDTAAETESAELESEQTEPEESKKEPKDKKKENKALVTGAMIAGVILGIGLAILLFIWLPARVYAWLGIPFPDAFNPENRYWKSVFEGLLKVLILVGYMAAISLMKDIRKTFQYHGAEHKTIFCYEMGLELTVENVKKMRKYHPRCGTSFLILMVLVGILISFLIPPTLPVYARVLIKLALVPVIMGVGYELIKFAGRHDNILTKIISAPGMWLQHITVREPDEGMIECAIAAFRDVLPAEESCDGCCGEKPADPEGAEGENGEESCEEK